MANSDVLVRMRADTQNYDANIAKARKQLDAFKDANFTASGAMRQVQNSLVQTAARFASVTAAIGAVTAAFRYNIETAKKFEVAMSQLSSLTGMVGKDLETLKGYAIELGSSTTLTASEVADAFKMIGSQQPQLLQSAEALKEVTKQAITLSEAAGIDLATASQTLSTSINQMGGDSGNASRFVNVLAAASQKGAGDIAWLGEAVTKSGTAARAVGTDYEELVANLEMLAKAGFDASTAGTALRSIIMNLEKQANNDFKPSVVGLTKAFENLGKAHLSIAEYQKITGKMFASQAIALAEMAGEARNLTDAITGTNTAEEQAAINTDNFAGSIKKLESAWEGFNLQLNSSNGMLKTFIDRVTEAVQSFSQYAFKNPTSLWDRSDNIENPDAEINKKPQKKRQASGVKGSYVVVTDANGNTISATHYDGLPPAETTTPATTTSTKTPKVPKVKNNAWAPIDMGSYDFSQISLGRSIADVQKNLALAQKQYNEAGDAIGRAAAQALIDKYTNELQMMKSEGNPFADAYSHDFQKDIERNEKVFAETSKGEDTMSGRERIEKGLDGVAKIAGGLNQMGVKVPAEIEKAIAVMQGAMSVIQGVEAVMSVLGTTSLTANTAAVTANTAAMVAMTAAMEINTATNLIPGFKNGGVVPRAQTGMVIPGHDYNDNTLLYASSGETILNKAQSNVVAGLLEKGEQGGGMVGTPYVEGEKIFLGINNFLRRSGRGEIVTSR